MMSVRVLAAAAVVVGIVVADFAASSAPAAADSPPLNGIYIAYSDGAGGTRNDVPYGWLYPYPDVTQTWNIATSCFVDTCDGQVASDQGWTAKIHYAAGRWFLTFDRQDGGIVCQDGSLVPTHQTYGFIQDQLVGSDTMTGPSGACNRNPGIQIIRPLTVTRVGDAP